MDKIYRRNTQSDGKEIRKKKDEHARLRNNIMNFRVSPRERELIEKRIRMSGLPKAEFFIESCLYQTILVRGNVKTLDRIRESMQEIDRKLRDGDLSSLDEGDRVELRTILELLEHTYRESPDRLRSDRSDRRPQRAGGRQPDGLCPDNFDRRRQRAGDRQPEPDPPGKVR